MSIEEIELRVRENRDELLEKHRLLERHGSRESLFITDLLSVEGKPAPAWLVNLDREIAKYAEKLKVYQARPLKKQIESLEQEAASHKKSGPVDWSLLSKINEDIKVLRRQIGGLYREAYTGTWDAILTRNGTRLMTDAVRLPFNELFPTEERADFLRAALSTSHPEDAQKALARALCVLSLKPIEHQDLLEKRYTTDIFEIFGEPQPEPDISKPQDVPSQVSELGHPEIERLLNESWPKPGERVDSLEEVSPVGKAVPEDAPAEPKSEPAPLKHSSVENLDVPQDSTPVAVVEQASAPQKSWARRALGTLFNAAAGAGAGAAVRVSTLALTGGSVVAAIGAGAAFAGVLSVGRAHMDNVRARKVEQPQAQGWALHRDVFAQNKKSYLGRFLTSAAIFAGAGSVGYAYGGQIVGWVSDKMDSVASLFHSAADQSAAVAPPAPVPAVAPAVPAAPAVQTPELPPIPSALPDALVQPAAPVESPAVSTMPAPAASRAALLDQAREALSGRGVPADVQDAMSRAASENVRVRAQGIKDLADALAPKNPALALSLAEEALKVNPNNAQAALFVAHYETHGLGGASVDLNEAYQKAAQVKASSAPLAQRREAAELLRYITRTLRFQPGT